MRMYVLTPIVSGIIAFFVLVGQAAASTSEARRAICSTFGGYCSQALRVAWCESHLNVYARNGQYLGMFQMGSSERARYGHSNNPWVQARAAYRYFRESGRDWSPWACKPW